MRARGIHNEVHPTRFPRGGFSQRRGGKAGPPYQRQSTQPMTKSKKTRSAFRKQGMGEEDTGSP